MMRLAFYIAKHGNYKDWAIDFVTGRYGYSHVELIFSDGMCFSSSPREGKCRFKFISDIETSGHWNIIDIKTTHKEKTVYENCKKIDGKKYDWMGIFFHQSLIYPSLQNRFGYEDPDKYWCSEAIQTVLSRTKTKISPNIMAQLWKVKGV